MKTVVLLCSFLYSFPLLGFESAAEKLAAAYFKRAEAFKQIGEWERALLSFEAAAALVPESYGERESLKLQKALSRREVFAKTMAARAKQSGREDEMVLHKRESDFYRWPRRKQTPPSSTVQKQEASMAGDNKEKLLFLKKREYSEPLNDRWQRAVTELANEPSKEEKPASIDFKEAEDFFKKGNEAIQEGKTVSAFGYYRRSKGLLETLPVLPPFSDDLALRYREAESALKKVLGENIPLWLNTLQQEEADGVVLGKMFKEIAKKYPRDERMLLLLQKTYDKIDASLAEEWSSVLTLYQLGGCPAVKNNLGSVVKKAFFEETQTYKEAEKYLDICNMNENIP